MKQCSRCARTYSDELTYCLDDGTRLLAYDDSEETQVYPQPSPPSPPSPPAPTPAKNTAKIVVGVILTIVVVVGLLGALVLALWWQGRGYGDTAQNSNSAPASDNWRVNGSPSPTVTPHPSPSPSPSPTIAEPVERNLSTGTYQCEVNQTLKSGEQEGNGTIKYQFTFNSDGTYLMQGYITVYGTSMTDQLGIEEKGTYTQSNGSLLLEDRLDREYYLETNSWKSWTVPSEGSESHEQIRNVTPTTFQLYYGDKKAWFTFAKL